MRKIAILIGAVAILSPASAFAQEAPDMLGTWTGANRAVVSGAGGHYGDGEDAATFRAVELTIEWTAQDDGRLIGTIASPLSTEPKVGVLSSDGVTLFTADSDGSSVGRLIDADHFELCYMQTSIADERIVVSCVEFEHVAQ